MGKKGKAKKDGRYQIKRTEMIRSEKYRYELIDTKDGSIVLTREISECVPSRELRRLQAHLNTNDLFNKLNLQDFRQIE